MTHHRKKRDKAGKWSAMDTRWGGTLFGTAVGAGILYLPVTVSVGASGLSS